MNAITDPVSVRPPVWRRMKSIALLTSIFTSAILAHAQADYAPAHWTPPACVKYWSNGDEALGYYGEGGPAGRFFCVIHDMEGYYWTSISYLNRCDTNSSGDYNVDASIHYLVNGVQNGAGENNPGDPIAGDITQSVRETNYAWHAVCWNPFMLGTEHEGFVSNPAWFTEAMYQASAGLHRHLCDTWGIPKDRNHIIGHNEWQNPTWTSWMAVNWPNVRTTCNTHTDPGVFWHWSHFIELIAGGNTNIGTYWDLNGATPGAGSAPSGTWDLTSYNWSTDPNGAVVPGLWTGQTAIFSAGSDATNAYTITVSGVQAVNNLLVQKGTVTFTGGQINFTGFGTYYSNYVAAGCTSIFNVPFGGTGAPDKWGPGTTVYNRASTNGGYFSLNQGTLALGHNSALSNVRLEVGDANGYNFVTLQAADSNARTLANNLVLNANSFSFGAGGNLTFTGGIDTTPNSGAASSIAVSNSITTFSGVVSDTAGFTKTGPGMLVLSGASANTYGSATVNGYTTVNGGTLKLSKTAGAAAVPSGALIVNSGGTLLLGASDQVGDAVTMTLGGGVFQTGGYNEQLGTLKLSANSQLDLGAGASVVRFAASSGVAWTGGAILTITNWNGSIYGGGTERVFFGTSSSGLSIGQVGQIRFANPPGFPAGSYEATILASGEVVPLTAAPAIVLQPTNRVAVVGDTLSLGVGASGTPTPAYQWRFYGTNLPGANGALLLLANVRMDQAGPYLVSITNIAGTTNSSDAVLSVYATAAPTLSGARYSSTDGFRLDLTGVPGYRYAILSSTNLADWTALQTNISPFTLTDTNAGGFPRRFYRAEYLP